MHVKIIGCLLNTYWYSDMVGKVMEVEEFDVNWYRVNTGLGCVMKCDVVPLTEKEVVQHELEQAKKEVAALEEKLANIGRITLNDIVAGAVFEMEYGEIKVIRTLYLDGEVFRMGGYHDNQTMMFKDKLGRSEVLSLFKSRNAVRIK